MKNNKVIRVGLYERVSTDEQALHGYSIEAQIDALEQFCKDKGYKIVEHYTDAGVSGGKASAKRPAMARLLEDVQDGKIDMILFTKLDRWFRNIQEYFKVQEILEKNRVEWKAIMEDYDTTTANGRMAITIFLAVAQNEREKGSERIQVVFEHKRRNKEACFGGKNPPLGYMKQKDADGIWRLVFNPETEPAAREFWRMLSEGSTIMGAGRIVNATFGMARDHKEWVRMFNTEFYRGMYKGVKDFCPAYIDADEWQKIKDSRKMKWTVQNRCYLFTGMVICPECGFVMTANYKKDGKGREYYSYRCRYTAVGKCTNSKSISERKAEKWLLANVKDRLEKFIVSAEIEDAKDKPKPKCDKVKISEKMRRLNVMYMAGGKSDEEYTQEMADLKRLLAEAERVAEDTKPRDLSPLREFLSSDFEEIYATLEQTEKRQLWRSIIDTLEVKGNDVIGVHFKA